MVFNEKKIIIFIQSYPPLKTALYLLDKYKKTASLSVYVFENLSIFHFFNKLNSQFFNNRINIYFVDGYRGYGFIPIKTISEKFYLTKRFKSVFPKDSRLNNEIFFFSKDFTDHQFYFIKRLFKNNRLNHIPDPGCDVYTIKDKKFLSFSESIKLILRIFVCGKSIRIGDITNIKSNSALFYKISDKFYRKNINKKFLPLERDRLLKDFKLDKYSFSNKYNYEVIYYDKELIKTELCDKDILKDDFKKIFKVISSYVSKNKVAIKLPGVRSSKESLGILSYGISLDHHIPAELYYSKKVKLYLGVTSTALSNIDNGTVISIAYLINYRSGKEIYRDRSIANQEKRSKGKIYYPKTMDEFTELVKSAISFT
tara:strand:+ start:32847 stop:33956 length:1110 start_codon:yes stop_codon:yes gene_type:complete